MAWLAVTFGFKLYVDIVGGANPVLGVLGGVIVSLTWLYLLAMTTLLGAEVNAVLADRRHGVAVAPRRPAAASATNGGEPAPVPTPWAPASCWRRWSSAAAAAAGVVAAPHAAARCVAISASRSQFAGRRPARPRERG